MWPFKQQKTFRADIQIPIDIPIPQTADGHRLEKFVTCLDCGQLILKDMAKAVEHRYPTIGWSSVRGRQETPIRPDSTCYYCQTHAPDWDVVGHNNSGGWCYYRRIAAVPERLEEVVEKPKPKAKKSKTNKGGE